MNNNTYIGMADGMVKVNGVDLDPCNHIFNHSPDGYSWGYYGSGPSQLALAIMVNEYGDNLSQHPIHYQDFKRGVISLLRGTFEITSDEIRHFIALHKAQTLRDADPPGVPIVGARQ